MPNDDNSLFRKKRIGYGYSPNGVGGWLVVLVIVAAVIGISMALRHL
jgi:uncharacterized membrane protein